MYDEIKKILIEEQKVQNGKLVKNLSIDQYVEKIKNKANILVHYSNGICLGFIAFYYNSEAKCGYISMVLISECGRGQGIAIGLLSATLYTMKSRGVTSCALEVLKNNNKAINLYKKLGFCISHEDAEYLKMSVDF